MNKLVFSACVLAAATAIFSAVPVEASADAATVSRAECVVEPVSRRFLYEKDASDELPMASTTKILTAIIIIDDCRLEDTVEIPAAAAGVEGSSVYLRAGDIYTVEELLYGLMLRSGNDCAETLALHHSGSIAAFARTMNQKAASIGAEHSRFMNPHGLPAKGHYTTAYDLSLIASYALENETFRKIVSTSYYAPKGWKNKNKMLERYDGATGIKTGFTLNAGRCLVTSAQREDMSLVCVVLNSPEMYERSAQLLDKAYAEYSLVKLCSGGDTVDGLRIDHGFSYPLKASEMGEVHIETIKKNPLPAHKGEIAGLMQIHLGNRLIFSQNMYMI